MEYAYDIGALTGAIHSSDLDLENFRIFANRSTQANQGSTTITTTSGSAITADRAQQIAWPRCPADPASSSAT